MASLVDMKRPTMNGMVRAGVVGSGRTVRINEHFFEKISDRQPFKKP